MMRVLDLFSGIGGFSLGLERTGGFTTVAFCEVAEYPRRVLAKHWPGVPIYHDVRELSRAKLAADGLADIDVICGGFPCQDISVANVNAAGLAGERSGLWREFARLVGELRPRVVLVENVAALLGRGAADVIGDLAALRYDAEWAAIPAASIGAPHYRDRLWVVAYPECAGWAGREPVFSVLERQASASAEFGNSFAAARGALDGDFAGLRVGDGVSVASHRRRIRGVGNAVVPQIPELIGRAILAAEGLAP
jgi:DNA (cytosine-5)-methyltransferase 1